MKKLLLFLVIISFGCKKQEEIKFDPQLAFDELSKAVDKKEIRISDNKSFIKYKKLSVTYHEFSNSNHPLGYVIIDSYNLLHFNYFIVVDNDVDYINTINSGKLIISINGDNQVTLNLDNSNSEAVKLFRTSEAVIMSYCDKGKDFTEEDVIENAKKMMGRKYGIARVKK